MCVCVYIHISDTGGGSRMTVSDRFGMYAYMIQVCVCVCVCAYIHISDTGGGGSRTVYPIDVVCMYISDIYIYKYLYDTGEVRCGMYVYI